MLIGIFQPSQRNNHTKEVFYGRRYDGTIGYYFYHVGYKLNTSADELSGWNRHLTEEDWVAGVRGHLEPMERQLNLFSLI